MNFGQGLRWALLILPGLAILALFWIHAPEPVIRIMTEKADRVEAPDLQLRIANALAGNAEALRHGALLPGDAQRMEIFSQALDAVSFILRDHAGKVVWSRNAPDTGRIAPAGLQAMEVQRTGVPVFQHMHMDRDGLLRMGAKVYLDMLGLPEDDHSIDHRILPIVVNGEILGTVEYYRDVTRLHESWMITLRLAVGGVVAVIGSVGLVVAWRIRKAGLAKISADKARMQAEYDHLTDQLRLEREVKLLSSLNEWLQSSKSLDELFYMVTRFMSHLMPEMSGSIYVYSNSRDVLDGTCSWAGGVHRPHIHPEDCWGLRRGRTYVYDDSEVKFVCGHVHDEPVRNYICIPFLAHGETVGMMHLSASCLISSQECERHRKLAQTCAEQISLAIANVRMRDELHYQAIRDSLTGLYNRRHMMDTLRRRIETRRNAPFTIVSIDVDRFKEFNDNHGHDAGDVVLRAVSEVLLAACNGNDIACRMGGEELMLLLTDADPVTALSRAEALRQAISELSVRYGDKTLPQVTVSIGVADYPGDGALPKDVIRAADEALYAAKAAGRNRVVSAKDILPGSFLPLTRAEDGAAPSMLAAQ